MNHTAFQAEEYDRKIRQTLPYYEDFYEQITDVLTILAKTEVSWLDIGCGTGKMYGAAQKKSGSKNLFLQIFRKECWTFRSAAFRQRKTTL